MASREKKPPLTEIDLARAATAPERQRRSIVKAGSKEGGYPYYKGFTTNLPIILKTPINSLLPAARLTRRQISRAVGRASGKRKGEKKANRSVAFAIYDFMKENKATSAEFIHDPVPLGRAGKRVFWLPVILKIRGKRYITFIDPRLRKGLDDPARTFFFSIMNTYIRLQDEMQFGDVGFLILQLAQPNKGKREVIAHYDDGKLYWTDKQLGEMIDAVYRALDEIEIERAAAA